MRSVIFDLDGTLMDTSGDLIAAANARFRALGLGDMLDPIADAAMAFRGGRAMLRLGFSRTAGFGEVDVEAQFAPFIAAYTERLTEHTYIYPGAMEAVEALRGAGYGVGICTNKPEAQTEALLRAMGVRDAFGAVVAADTLPVRKPDPAPLREAVRRLGGDPARTCLVGDTDTDRETARAAGVPSVLVTFGPVGDQMAALAPEALVDHYDDLPGVVEALKL